jgi:thiol-disulfide isomerase/thioredoxin
MLATLLCAAATLCVAPSPSENAPGEDDRMPRLGTWHGWLDCPGGDLPFGLQLEAVDGGLFANILNGPEIQRVERVEVDGEHIVLHLDPYDATLQAQISADGARLDGQWVRDRGEASPTTLEFHATFGARPRFQLVEMKRVVDFELDGRWKVQFSESAEHAVGIFRTKDVLAQGTFLTTLGDYRFNAGVFDGQVLELSCFDGAHAFLFEAHAQHDGSLKGKFWSRDVWVEDWTAVRDAEVALPDPFGLTRWTGAVPLSELAFPDLEGAPRRLDDPAFAGQARLIVVFGSWCPNCNDETQYLVELHDRYADRGLSILGLAFEFGDDLARQTRTLQRYKAHHGARYPVLIAGTADKAQASAAFPLLDRVRAFPTTIFMDADGAVAAIYTGFSGPATGAEHQRLRDAFEARIERLLRAR